MKEPTLKSTISLCEDFGFGEEITRETIWNEAYRLGRRRWYWGPWWFVNVIGWVNTQKDKLKKYAATKRPK